MVCWLGFLYVENNALSAPDAKQRQDAKWSLPYLEGDKKVQAEKLSSDLDAKDKAFDAAIDAACKNLPLEDCRGMRHELATMGNRLSNDEKSNISALSILATGLAGGVVGNSLNAAGTGAVGGKVAVENDYLSDIAQAQSEGKTLEQKAGEHVKAENERYKKANCGGTQKMFDELGIKNIEVKVVKE